MREEAHPWGERSLSSSSGKVRRSLRATRDIVPRLASRDTSVGSEHPPLWSVYTFLSFRASRDFLSRISFSFGRRLRKPTAAAAAAGQAVAFTKELKRQSSRFSRVSLFADDRPPARPQEEILKRLYKLVSTCSGHRNDRARPTILFRRRGDSFAVANGGRCIKGARANAIDIAAF